MSATDELLDNYRRITESALDIARDNFEDAIKSANRAVVAEAQKRQSEENSDRCVFLCAVSMLFSLVAFIVSIIHCIFR